MGLFITTNIYTGFVDERDGEGFRKRLFIFNTKPLPRKYNTDTSGAVFCFLLAVSTYEQLFSETYLSHTIK